MRGGGRGNYFHYFSYGQKYGAQALRDSYKSVVKKSVKRKDHFYLFHSQFFIRPENREENFFLKTKKSFFFFFDFRLLGAADNCSAGNTEN
jgi:hypothetical protein